MLSSDYLANSFPVRMTKFFHITSEFTVRILSRMNV